MLFFSLRANFRENLRGLTPALRGAQRHDLMLFGLSYAEVLRLSSAVLRPSAPGGANFIEICEERLFGKLRGDLRRLTRCEEDYFSPL